MKRQRHLDLKCLPNSHRRLYISSCFQGKKSKKSYKKRKLGRQYGTVVRARIQAEATCFTASTTSWWHITQDKLLNHWACFLIFKMGLTIITILYRVLLELSWLVVWSAWSNTWLSMAFFSESEHVFSLSNFNTLFLIELWLSCQWFLFIWLQYVTETSKIIKCKCPWSILQMIRK